MPRHLQSHLLISRAAGIGRATRLGLLIGGALIITGAAVPAAAATSRSDVMSAKSQPPPPAPGTHTKTKPVVGARPPAKPPTRRAATLGTPATATSAALPDSTCILVGGARACDLYAMRGTIAVPGMATALPIWGFADNAAGPASLPGPTLVALEGESLKVTLHNALPAGAGQVALEISGSSTVPDLTGVPTGSSAPYTFDGLKPGTYLYEAGATDNGQRQVAMGLAGLLVVRPRSWSTTCHSAYDESVAGACDGTQFTAEAPVQVSELSSDFNVATDTGPTSRDLHDYKPDVFLVNGRSFDSASPLTGSIPVSAGDHLLLRYADLGLRERSISIANSRQVEMATDGNLLKVQPELASIYLNPAQTADTLMQVDAALPLGTLVPLYDEGQHLTHWVNGQPIEGAGIGGMMAMLDVVNGLAGTPAGPRTVTVVTPKVNDLNPGNPADTESVKATITSATASPITRAEWFLDNVGAPGTGQAIASTCAPDFCFAIDPTTMQSLLAAAPSRNGQHVIWVHGMDANGWGIASGDSFTVDLSGPLVSSISVHSSPTNGARPNDLDGTTNLDIVGTASASLSGWVITAAEVCVDAPCSTMLQPNPGYDQPGAPYGSFTNSFSLNLVSAANGNGTNDPVGPVVGINGAIPFASLPSTADGAHTFYIHACEAPTPPADPAAVTPSNCGRWGDAGNTITPARFIIDTVAPATTITAVAPDPNNGFVSGPGNTAYLNEERVTAVFDDTGHGGSTISSAEVFISQPGVLPWCYTGPLNAPLANCPGSPPAGFFGTGAEMVPVGGIWNTAVSQQADAFIPLTDIRAFPEGHVWFWVHGRDTAGNWTAFTDPSGNPQPSTHYALTLDKTNPIMDTPTVVSAPSPGATTVTFRAHDDVHNGVSSNIARAEYFIVPCTPASDASCFQDPGPGNGTPIAVPANGGSVTIAFSLPTPIHGQTLFVRVMDGAGNWAVLDLNASNFAETNEPGGDPPVCANSTSTNCEQVDEYGPMAAF